MQTLRQRERLARIEVKEADYNTAFLVGVCCVGAVLAALIGWVMNHFWG